METVSSGSEMAIAFLTDDGNNRMEGRWDAVPGGCGAHFIKNEGSFTSPNYPEAYPHNSDCEWLLDTTPGNNVNLYFTDFYVEFNSACRYDFVKVYDGPNMTYPLLGTFCGYDIPEPVRSTSNQMFVHFTSDASLENGHL